MNKEMRDKMEAAFAAAGKEVPKKQEAKEVSEAPKAEARRSKSKEPKRAKRQRREYPPEVKKCAIQQSLASLSVYHKGEKKSADFEKEQAPLIRAKANVRFKPNNDFTAQSASTGRRFLKEGAVDSQFSGPKMGEIELIIGLDLGTSNTKVVIGDPASRRFFAVPFDFDSSNPYLVPTILGVDEYGDTIVGLKSGYKRHQSLKLKLMQEESSAGLISTLCQHLTAFIGHVLRYSIRWFMKEHKDAYGDMSLLWRLSIGAPAAKLKLKKLKFVFEKFAIAGCQLALSDKSTISVKDAERFFQSVTADKAAIYSGQQRYSKFLALGSDEGVVVVVPEIAAQVVGFYRSRQWDPSYPFTFVLDVGAGTVDAAVFSLVSPSFSENDLKFCAFSCAVEELGMVNLHLRRIKFLEDYLPEDAVDKSEIRAYLRELESSLFSNLRIPASVSEYINNVEIRSDTRLNVDKKFQSDLSRKIYDPVLVGALQKSQGDSGWKNLRTIICGGGGRSPSYKKFVENVARHSKIKAIITQMSKPSGLQAPGLPADEFDRISVAYGLAQGTYWEFEWPEDIDESKVNASDYTERFVSKDMM